MLLPLDIDHFKNINDSYGHQASDATLQQLATLLNNNCRSDGYVFRHGGEQFLMLLVDITAEKALKIAENLRNPIEQENFRLP